MPVAIGGFHKNRNSILWETRIGFAVHLHNNIYVAKQPDRSIDPWSGEGLWWSRECRGQGMTTDEYDGAFPAASPDDYDDDVATSAAGVVGIAAAYDDDEDLGFFSRFREIGAGGCRDASTTTAIADAIVDAADAGGEEEAPPTILLRAMCAEEGGGAGDGDGGRGGAVTNNDGR